LRRRCLSVAAVFQAVIKIYTEDSLEIAADLMVNLLQNLAEDELTQHPNTFLVQNK
jgi:hypothetical protein